MTRPGAARHVQYPFGLIVVGAGINGAGSAHDAAMRGPRILVLDKGDVSSGTTQWATRLIHGGLRYLEHHEVCAVCSPRGFSCKPVSLSASEPVSFLYKDDAFSTKRMVRRGKKIAPAGWPKPSPVR